MLDFQKAAQKKEKKSAYKWCLKKACEDLLGPIEHLEKTLSYQPHHFNLRALDDFKSIVLRILREAREDA